MVNPPNTCMEMYGIWNICVYHCVGSKFILRQGSRWLPDISKLSLPGLSCAKPAFLVAPHADQAPLSATGKMFVAQRPVSKFHLSIWMLVELMTKKYQKKRASVEASLLKALEIQHPSNRMYRLLQATLLLMLWGWAFQRIYAPENQHGTPKIWKIWMSFPKFKAVVYKFHVSFQGFCGLADEVGRWSRDQKSRIKHPNQLSIDIVEARLEEF